MHRKVGLGNYSVRGRGQNDLCVKDGIETYLADLPFEPIHDGEKAVEARLYDEKSREFGEGDAVLFCREDGPERFVHTRRDSIVPTSVVLFEIPDTLKKGILGHAPANVVDCMYRYCSALQERRRGVLGIELCDLKWSKGRINEKFGKNSRNTEYPC